MHSKIITKPKRDVQYSQDVHSFIDKKHKKWAQTAQKVGKMQSINLYRPDNMKKKVWRSLRHIVSDKIKQLIHSLPCKSRKDPVCVYKKINNFLQSYNEAHDEETKLTLVSCIIFLGMKKSHMKLIEKLPIKPEYIEVMREKVEKFKEMNDNKIKSVTWRDISIHPVNRLAKSLFYKSEESQNIFFKKVLGCNQKDITEEKRTMITIIDDYEVFRVKMLHTLEKEFKELY